MDVKNPPESADSGDYSVNNTRKTEDMGTAMGDKGSLDEIGIDFLAVKC